MVWRSCCSIPPQQGSPLLGALHSSHFPCLMTFRHLPWLHPPSGLWGLAHSSCWSSCPTLPDLPGLGEARPIGSQSPGWLASYLSETPAQLVEWLAAHALSESKDLHLLSLAAGVLLSLLTHKTELIVRGVYGVRRSVLRSLLLSLLFMGTMCTMPPGKTLPLLLWPPLCKSCYHGLPRRRGPLPFVFSPNLKLVQARVRTWMPVTPTRINRSGMPSLSHGASPWAISATASTVGQSSGLC